MQRENFNCHVDPIFYPNFVWSKLRHRGQAFIPLHQLLIKCIYPQSRSDSALFGQRQFLEKDSAISPQHPVLPAAKGMSVLTLKVNLNSTPPSLLHFSLASSICHEWPNLLTLEVTPCPGVHLLTTSSAQLLVEWAPILPPSHSNIHSSTHLVFEEHLLCAWHYSKQRGQVVHKIGRKCALHWVFIQERKKTIRKWKNMEWEVIITIKK
jgi:hypothetical protein